MVKIYDTIESHTVLAHKSNPQTARIFSCKTDAVKLCNLCKVINAYSNSGELFPGSGHEYSTEVLHRSIVIILVGISNC